ncbi:hypothetical protein HY640_04380 [Candidatus Woesearchaeota archaeon]|nr:hypothetical protein [Candidatus Woesearchaeota archaeon]
MSIETEYMRYFAEKHRDENEGAEGRKAFLGAIMVAVSAATYIIFGYTVLSISLAALGVYLLSGFRKMREYAKRHTAPKHA